MPDRADQHAANRRAFADLCERVAPDLETTDRHAMFNLARLLRAGNSRIASIVEESKS